MAEPMVEQGLLTAFFRGILNRLVRIDGFWKSPVNQQSA